MWRPGFSTELAKYSSKPYRRIEISLNVDRTQGQLIPEIEGETCYIERADYPVLISFTTGDNDQRNTIPAIEGKQFAGPFKGFVITHPQLVPSATLAQEFKLVLIVGVSNAFTNQLGDAASRFPPPFRIITNTVTSQVQGFYLPPNVRRIKAISYAVTATAVAAVLPIPVRVSFIAQDGASFYPGPANLVNKPNNGASVTYTQPMVGQIYLPFQVIPSVVAGTTVTQIGRAQDLIIPPNAFEVQVDCGQALTTALSLFVGELYYS